MGGDKVFHFEEEGFFFFFFKCIYIFLTREIKWFSVRKTSAETLQPLIWIKLKVGILDVISRDSLTIFYLSLNSFFPLSRKHSDSQTSLPALVDAARGTNSRRSFKIQCEKTHAIRAAGKMKKEKELRTTVQEKLHQSSKPPKNILSSCLQNQKAFGDVSEFLLSPGPESRLEKLQIEPLFRRIVDAKQARQHFRLRLRLHLVIPWDENKIPA